MSAYFKFSFGEVLIVDLRMLFKKIAEQPLSKPFSQREKVK
jgi:hypothetical protein